MIYDTRDPLRFDRETLYFPENYCDIACGALLRPRWQDIASGIVIARQENSQDLFTLSDGEC